MDKYVTAQRVCVVETGLIQVAEVGKLFLVEVIFDLVPFEIQRFLDGKREVKVFRYRKYHVSWSLPFK